MSRIITPGDWRAQPWKNGDGITHEIVRWPAGDGDDWDVRVSLAEVTRPGPFSTFPGYHRWTTLLDEARIGLRGSRETYWISRGHAFQLDGATQLTAHLPDGPTHVLNVIARPNLIAVGNGSTGAKVRFVFAMSACHGLERWQARVLEPRTSMDGDVIWLWWLDWREDPERVATKKPRTTKKPRPR